MENTAAAHTYALGYSEEELERLSRQARAFEPFTRQVLLQAGVRAGMRVLDVGCGSGDVAFFAAELVGSGGEVVGADCGIAAVEWATARAHSRGAKNVNFVLGDPTLMEFDQPFDAVLGRLVLMYYPDPADAIRKLAKHVRSGGLIVFQEFDIANARSHPAATFDQCVRWIKQALIAAGARTQLGLELHSVFVDAGLPAPTLRLDGLIGGGPENPGYGLVTEVIQTVLPLLERFKIATAAEVDLPTLVQRMRGEVVACKGVTLSPALIGAWSNKLA
jgi:2-polyprenyl-3-methyl-5-hydroxy-6-metoxy-1,4-benzoquinol methylase